MSKTFEATAMGDVIHFKANDLDDAKSQLTAMTGGLPDDLVTWAELDALPDGCEYAADFR